jgi:hypothetical protein
MDEESNEPQWLPPLSLVVLGLFVWVVSLSPWALIPIRVTGQALLLIIALRAFCYWPPMVRWVTGMPAVHRTVFALVLGSMIFGHYTLNNRTYYPFVSWFIFPTVREDDPVTCREFIATTASGKQVRLIVEQLFPSIVQIFPLDDPNHYPPEKMEQLARALSRAYNQRHADDPVRTVDLTVMAVKLHPPASESRAEPSCQLLQRYEISSAR